MRGRVRGRKYLSLHYWGKSAIFGAEAFSVKNTETLYFEKLALRVSEHGIEGSILSNEIIEVIESNISPCWIICWLVFTFS